MRKETPWPVPVFGIKQHETTHYLLTWKNVFLWTLVFRIKLYSLYSPSGISCQARNHLTDISQRKFQCNFFLIVDFSFPFSFFPFYWRNQMGREAGASSSPRSPPGTEAEHSWLPLLSHTGWRWWWGCLDSGDNCWEGQEFTLKLPLDWGAEVWRVRTAWGLTFGFHWSGLPQMTFDSVGMKLTHVTWDAVRCFLVCVSRYWLGYFAGSCLSAGFWLGARSTHIWAPFISLHLLNQTSTNGTDLRLILGTCECVFPCSSAWKSQTSALEGVWR